ncbi:MAG: magnesium transporter CorA family protein [Actinobacteria bacterium]|nr:magnesium transporter CorA family protein [Actinomycetota bacterium]
MKQDECTPGIRTRVWRNGTLEAEGFPFDQVSTYLDQEDTLVWADLFNPDHETICKLADELSLDQHAVEDALAHRERPKATRYATHVFMTTYAIGREEQDERIRLGRVSAFSTKRAFVTVRLDDTLDMDQVVQRWDDNADLLKYGPRALVHGLLDTIVDQYFEVIESLDDEIEQIEDLLFEENTKAAGQVSRTTFQLRRSLVEIRRAILPMREVVNTIMRRAGEDHPELTPYYEDLYDHVLRAAEWTESLRDMITSIFETNMSLADNRMNLIMKKLTSWAAIIAVPTAITGYFGQNVPYPGFSQHWGFWLSTLAILLIAAALYVTFKRKDWL